MIWGCATRLGVQMPEWLKTSTIQSASILEGVTQLGLPCTGGLELCFVSAVPVPSRSGS